MERLPLSRSRRGLLVLGRSRISIRLHEETIEAGHASIDRIDYRLSSITGNESCLVRRVAVRLGISFFVTIFDELRLRFVGGFKL
jgi:hypothetical protein